MEPLFDHMPAVPMVRSGMFSKGVVLGIKSTVVVFVPCEYFAEKYRHVGGKKNVGIKIDAKREANSVADGYLSENCIHIALYPYA